MTNAERSRIVELQQKGYGYKKIATITGLPQNTVKSYCSRHPVQKNDFAESEGLCRNCKSRLSRHRINGKGCSAPMPAEWRGGTRTPKECSEKRTTHSLAGIAGSSLKAMATASGVLLP